MKLGFGITHYAGRKQRTVGPMVATADEGKTLAQTDYDRGEADERTQQADQPIGVGLKLR